MTDDQYVAMVREIEAAKGKQTAHEQVCAERYKALDDKMIGFSGDLTDLKGDIAAVKAAVTAGVGRVSKWRDKALYAIISVLFGFGAWAGGQLWSLLPHH